jgi:hypothetical protein
MRFKVREGFAIHFSRLVDIPGLGGEVVQEVQTNSYYAGQVVEFTADEALDHAHKLEPFDKDAKAWLESRAVAVAPPPTAGIDPATLADIVAKAVAAAVAAPATPVAQAGA